MTKLSNTISIVVGDWSDDGHGKTAHYQIQSNLSHKEISKAYKKGSKKLGFDFSETVASSYDDSEIPAEELVKLREAGWTGEFYDVAEPGEPQYLEADTFMEIWLFIAKLGNPLMEYEIPAVDSTLNIGGYGLFQ